MTFSQTVTLVDTLARFHLKGESRQYFLGNLWWVLEPLLYVGVFYLVFETLLDSRQPDFLYFLIVGKVTFIWFSKSVNQAASSLEANKGLMAQTNLRKELFPLAVILQGLYRQFVVFLFLIGFLIIGGYPPSATWLWLIPLAALQTMLITACGLLGALLVSVKRDFRLVIQLGTVFLLFMSGIFWDLNTVAEAHLRGGLLVLNPLANLIDCYRQVLMRDEAPNAIRLAWVLGESLLLLIPAWVAYDRLQFWIARQVVNR